MHKMILISIMLMVCLNCIAQPKPKTFVGRFHSAERSDYWGHYTFLTESNEKKIFSRDLSHDNVLPYMLLLFETTNPQFKDLWFRITYVKYKAHTGDKLEKTEVDKFESIELIDTPPSYDTIRVFVGIFYWAEASTQDVLYTFTKEGIDDLQFLVKTSEHAKIKYPLMSTFMANTKYLGKTFSIKYKKRYVPKLNHPSGELISLDLVE